MALNRNSLLWVAFRGRCHYCGIACTPHIGLRPARNNPALGTRDHIIPASKGGSDRFENLVLSCRRCNNLRGNMKYEKFLHHCDKLYWKLYKIRLETVPAQPRIEVEHMPRGVNVPK